MGTINRAVDIEMGGQLRKIKFTTGALEQLEANISCHNVMQLMQTGVFSLTDLITATWVGLRTYDKALMRKQVAVWVGEYNASHEVNDLTSKVYAAIGLSGLFGSDVRVFQDILSDAETETNAGVAEDSEDTDTQGE